MLGVNESSSDETETRWKKGVAAATLAGRAAKNASDKAGRDWSPADGQVFYRNMREKRRLAREQKRREEIASKEQTERAELAKIEEQKARERQSLLEEKRRREQITKVAHDKRPATKGILAVERIPAEPCNPDAWRTEESTKELIGAWDGFEETCEDIRASESRLHDIYNKMFQGEQDELVERLEAQLEQEKKWRGGDYNQLQSDLTKAQQTVRDLRSSHDKDVAQHVQDSKTQIRLMEGTIAKLEAKLATSESNLRGVEDEKGNQAAQLGRELTAQKEAYLALQEELDSAKMEAAADQERLRVQIGEAEDLLHTEIARLKEENAVMNEKVAKAERVADNAEGAARRTVEDELFTLRKTAATVEVIERERDTAQASARDEKYNAGIKSSEAEESWAVKTDLEDKLAAARERSTELQETISTMASGKASQKRELKMSEGQVDRLRKEISLLKKTVTTLETDLSTVQAGKSAELEAEAESNRQMKEINERDLEEQKAANIEAAEKQQKELHSLQSTLEAEREAFEEERRGVAESIALQLEQQRNAFEIKMDEEKRVIEESTSFSGRKEQEKAAMERKRLKDEIGQMEDAGAESASKIATLQSESKALQQELDSARAQLTDVEQGSERLTQEVNRLKDLRGSAEVKSARLQTEIANSTDRIARLLQEANMAASTIVAGEERVNLLEHQVSNLKSRIMNADQNVSERESVIEQHENRNSELSQKYISLERERDELQEQFVTVSETLDKTEENATQMQKTLTTTTEENTELQAEMERMKTVEEDTEAWKSKATRLAEQLATIGFNEDRVATLEEENSSFKTKSSDLRTRLATAKLAAEVAEKKVARLQKEGTTQSESVEAGPTESMIKENFSLKQQLNSTESKAEGYKNEIASLKKSLNASSLTRARAQCVDAKEAKNRAEAQLEKVKRELEKTKGTLRNRESEYGRAGGSKQGNRTTAVVAPGILSTGRSQEPDQKYIFVKSTPSNDNTPPPAVHKSSTKEKAQGNGTLGEKASPPVHKGSTKDSPDATDKEENQKSDEEDDDNSLDARLFGAIPDDERGSDIDGSSDTEDRSPIAPKRIADLTGT